MDISAASSAFCAQANQANNKDRQFTAHSLLRATQKEYVAMKTRSSSPMKASNYMYKRYYAIELG